MECTFGARNAIRKFYQRRNQPDWSIRRIIHFHTCRKRCAGMLFVMKIQTTPTHTRTPIAGINCRRRASVCVWVRASVNDTAIYRSALISPYIFSSAHNHFNYGAGISFTGFKMHRIWSESGWSSPCSKFKRANIKIRTKSKCASGRRPLSVAIVADRGAFASQNQLHGRLFEDLSEGPGDTRCLRQIRLRAVRLRDPALGRQRRSAAGDGVQFGRAPSERIQGALSVRIRVIYLLT